MPNHTTINHLERSLTRIPLLEEWKEGSGLLWRNKKDKEGR